MNSPFPGLRETPLPVTATGQSKTLVSHSKYVPHHYCWADTPHKRRAADPGRNYLVINTHVGKQWMRKQWGCFFVFLRNRNKGVEKPVC